ncbi:hypothetical protein [Xenorhabdus bovienii]|uniref:Zinc ribbon domain-containing protein n=1 Tax=Xenorhabdus bovienii str. kraussei Becker Underwood TaxID=1398204 RepID=A0A077PPW6_XENBV|nr:hypothetical protein [Xenorhabdus bovienii]CDH26355.1 conserved exported hypothetical protein [Xenorhabdus bovienii str. kraussei Becker Underwood]
MKNFGIFLLVIGVLAVFASFNMDVSVATGYGGRVNNIGLVAQRENLLLISCFVVLCGLLLAIFGGKKTLNGDSKNNQMKCPFCAEQINVEALKCKHCGSDVQEKIEEITLKKFKPSSVPSEFFYKRRKDGIELIDDRVKELSETLIKANIDKDTQEIELHYQSEIESLNKRLPKAIQKQFQDRYAYWLHNIDLVKVGPIVEAAKKAVNTEDLLIKKKDGFMINDDGVKKLVESFFIQSPDSTNVYQDFEDEISTIKRTLPSEVHESFIRKIKYWNNALTDNNNK